MKQDTKKHILVIDSDKEWQERLCQLLSTEYVITKALTYDEASKAISLQSPPFQVIITEIQLDETIGDKYGFKIIQEMYELGNHTQAIVLTKFSLDKHTQYVNKAYTELKVFNYILKDSIDHFDFKQLLQIIRDAIKRADILMNLFVIMPFAPDKQEFYDVIKQTTRELEINCIRADEIGHLGEIMDCVRPAIRDADIVVSDLREQNPNVYYETGIADGYYKRVILVARDNEINSSMRSLRRLVIPNVSDWQTQLSIELKSKIVEIFDFIHNGEAKSVLQKIVSPIDPTLCLALVAGDADNQDTFEHIILPALRKMGLKAIQVNNSGYQLPLKRIWQQLNLAQLIIMDLSNKDAYMCYLAGLAIGVEKKIVFIVQQGDQIPTDFIEKSPIPFSKQMHRQRKKAEENIRMAIRDLLPVEPNDSQGKSVQKNSADVLLVTATQIESASVRKVIEEFTGKESKVIPSVVNTYFDFGEISEAHVMLVQTEMGAGGLAGAMLTIADAIDELLPSSVIMVGIAFGIDSDRQTIGEILVSKQILDYDLQRIGTGDAGQMKIIPRGNRIESSPRLLGRFRAGEQTWKNAKAKFGLILSGSKLIDNIDFRDQLLSIEPESIGGEMEGAGLFAVALRKKVDWILVKAICDWADGKKSVNIQINQDLAATNAARFVLHVLQQGGFTDL